MRYVILGLSTALAASACTAVSSDGLATNAIKATFTVSADQTGITSVTGSLMDGANYVKLSSDDHLSVTVGDVDGGTPTALTESTSLFNQTSYLASLSGDTAGTVYTIDFARPSGKTSAPTSTATLPEPIALTGFSGATISRSQDLTINWTTPPASAQSLAWSASGPCITPVSTAPITLLEGQNQMSYTIPANTLVSNSSSSSSGSSSTSTTCQVQFTLALQQKGTIDPAFESGSSIIASQTASATFTSTP